MVRPGIAHMLVILVVCVLGVSCAIQEETEFPSLLTALGSKLALADDYYDDDDSGTGDSEVPARPCCFPVVWQGTAYNRLAVAARRRGRRGKSGLMLSSSRDQFYVDGTNRRVAGHKWEFHGHRSSVNFSWIFSIGSNRTGDLHLFDTYSKKCEHRTLRNVVWRRQCIPSNATLHATASLGPVGSLTVQAWLFGGRTRQAPAINGDNRPRPRPRVAFGADILVVPKTCVPVLLNEHGFVFRGIDQQEEELSRQVDIHDTNSLNSDDSDYESYARRRAMLYRDEADSPGPHRRSCGVEFTTSSSYFNVLTRITDPSVFTVPAYCKKGDPNTLHYGEDSESFAELPTILERFIVL